MKPIFTALCILATTPLLAQSGTAPILYPTDTSGVIRGSTAQAGTILRPSGSVVISPETRAAPITPTEKAVDIIAPEMVAVIQPPEPPDPTPDPPVVIAPRIAPVAVTFDDIEFVFDETTFLPAAYGEITKIATLLKEAPGSKWLVVGHTDNIGPAGYNRALSLARAKAVIDELVTTHGIDRQRLFPKGMGESDPETSNATSDGRQRNRRVVLIRK